MKSHILTLKTYLYVIILGIATVGCSVQQKPEPQLNLNKYDKLSKAITTDLAHFNSKLEAQGANFSDTKKVEAIAVDYYGKNSKNLEAFHNNYNIHPKAKIAFSSNKDIPNKEIKLNDIVRRHLNEIRVKVYDYKDLSQY